MGRIDERLRELGIELPPVFPPAGNYLGCLLEGGLLSVGGHGPISGDRMITGKVGRDLDLDRRARRPA